jgi:hypothetical protein
MGDPVIKTGTDREAALREAERLNPLAPEIRERLALLAGQQPRPLLLRRLFLELQEAATDRVEMLPRLDAIGCQQSLSKLRVHCHNL